MTVDLTESPAAVKRAPRRAARRPRSGSGALRQRRSLAVVGAIVAFVGAVSLVNAARGERVEVMVAARDIGTGEAVTLDAVRFVEIDAESPVTAELVGRDELRAQSVASHAISVGEPVTAASLTAATGDGRRVMSLPITADRAAGGGLAVGERVDVVATTRDGAARFVVLDAEVVDRSRSSSTGALSAASEDWIAIRVTATEALALSAAIDSGAVQVLRSTGADPVPESETELTAPAETRPGSELNENLDSLNDDDTPASTTATGD